VLFPDDQGQLTLNIGVSGAGHLTFDFFGRNGALVGQVVVPITGPGLETLGFSRAGGLSDIAGFSVENNVPNGFGILGIGDNTRDETPEPGTLMSLGGGLLLLYGLRRMR
jgi:hypothetical protein